MIVSNASPLMYLSKIKKLILLKRLFKEITIPFEVYEEVVLSGKSGNFSDSLAVEHAKDEGWIIVKSPLIEQGLRKLAEEIDYGEAAVIAIAKKTNAALVLMDDASGRAIAETIGLQVKGTLFVLTSALEKKIINKEETKRLLAQLVREGFRISQELYAQTLEEIDKS